MKSLNNGYYNASFSHIYVEKDILNHPRTAAILKRFPKADVVEIDHYKDVFCRSGQQYVLQHHAQSLILAAKHANLIYEGAPVCQRFGNHWFYYASCMMNCVYDCEYCYLKGMYPSGNLVIFVNLEDIFSAVEEILAQHEVYLCVSYDADLLALEDITGYAAAWIEFAAAHQNLKIEIRTKSANVRFFQKQKAASNVIIAFTLSPQIVIDTCEHLTPPLESRLACAAQAMKQGFSVRLAFDPMIYCKNWAQAYEEMIERVTQCLDFHSVLDVSVGSFRISQDYMKRMRRNSPASAVVQFPYENEHGVYHYPQKLMTEMEQYLCAQLKKRLPAEKIFLWETQEDSV